MSSGIPFIRQIGWSSMFVHAFVILCIIGFWYWLKPEDYLFNGCLTYLFISFTIRRLLTRHHRTGIQNVRKQDYRSALPHFETSYEYFTRNEWIDRYRYLTLLTSSKISYKEMALVNIAFCYGQLGEQDKAITYYKRALSEFPDSQIARSALNLLLPTKE